MEDRRIDILIALLTTQVERMIAMRERVLNVFISSITVFTVFTGWFIQKPSRLSLLEVVLSIFIIVVFWIGNLLILFDIRRGFTGTHNILVRIEKSLKLYEKNALIEGDSVYPESYMKPMKATHFKKFEYMLSVAAMTSIVVVVIKYVLP